MRMRFQVDKIFIGLYFFGIFIVLIFFFLVFRFRYHFAICGYRSRVRSGVNK